jgi:hypothetical protein
MLLLLLFIYYLLTPLLTTFTIIHLKQTLFQYIMLQIFSGYNLWYVMLFATINVVYFWISTFRRLVLLLLLLIRLLIILCSFTF